ncbi:MAG: helix-turn-helix domain-containing GNAT family N-acetyltransferase [Spirochaetales bacterium]|nr:helix-turn-helix domain-containing GNAT family N-acetyltransferase [Spirochaetales bacterium]
MNDVVRVREFNRAVTQRVGALDNRFLGRNRSLGASRLLFEVGEAGSEVRELRARLGLDSGYTSRLLRTLRNQGLIRVTPSIRDSRVRTVILTAEGREERALLNRLSDEAASSILASLSEGQRRKLVEAMGTVERLLKASSVVLAVEDAGDATARACLEHYYGELNERFDTGFDPDRSLNPAAREMSPPAGYFVVARLHGEAVGCGGVKCRGDYGEIKRLWVDRGARGLGVARRVLGYLEDLARARGLPVVRLDTNKTLTEAIALYKSSGYYEIERFNDEPYADHWFEKRI